MLQLSSPGKALLLIFFISIGIFKYGLLNTALTLVVFVLGLVLYNWWVRNYHI